MEQNNHTTGKRKWEQLSEKERYKIEALSQQGLKKRYNDAAVKRNSDSKIVQFKTKGLRTLIFRERSPFLLR